MWYECDLTVLNEEDFQTIRGIVLQEREIRNVIADLGGNKNHNSIGLIGQEATSYVGRNYTLHLQGGTVARVQGLCGIKVYGYELVDF